jgi:hypothetical protein
MSHRQLNRREVLQPLLDVPEGTPVPFAELVHAGTKVAGGLVEPGRPIIMCGDAHWSGPQGRPGPWTNWTS